MSYLFYTIVFFVSYPFEPLCRLIPGDDKVGTAAFQNCCVPMLHARLAFDYNSKLMQVPEAIAN